MAQLQGSNALAGATGAAVGENAADIISHILYPTKAPHELSPDEKEQVSGIASIAGAMTGAIVGGGEGIADAVAGGMASKNAVENNYLSSPERSEKNILEYKQKHNQLTDIEQQRLIELQLKDGKSTEALISACSNPSSDACKTERKNAYDALERYHNLTYQNPKMQQAGYQEIENLLKQTAQKGDLMRQIYTGYKNSYIGLGYTEEEASVMAGRTISVQMITNGLTGSVSLSALNKVFGDSKLSGVGNEGKQQAGKIPESTNNNVTAGKGIKGGGIGKPAEIPHNSTPENIRSIVRENEGANILSQNGYHVEQNPKVPSNKNPDYKINGEIFDNIAPKTNSVRNIYDRVLEKVTRGQTNSVVINLADTKVSVSDLQKQFNDWPMKGLDKVIIIDQSGKLIRIKEGE